MLLWLRRKGGNPMEMRREALNRLLEALRKKDIDAFEKLYDHLEPVDVADEIEDLAQDQLAYFVSHIDARKIAEIIEEADEELQLDTVACLDDEHILAVFNYMAKDNIVDLLLLLGFDRRKRLINKMKADDQKIIENLLGYQEDTAGGLMTTEYIALNAHLNTIDALVKIKQIAPKTEVIDTIYAIDCQKKLVGTVDLRDLLSAEGHVKLEDIMNPHVVYVYPEMDQEEVSLLVSKYDLTNIPVVSKDHRMLGIITVDDIIDVLIEEHTEDMLGMHGVSKEETLDSSMMESLKLRLPWLMINLLTAFLASGVIAMFEGTIEQIVALSATMTIVTGMGGNAGSQTLSILIRGIALGEVKLKGCLPQLRKEIILGLMNGFLTGLVAGAVIYMTYHNFYLSLITILALMCNLMISGFFGFLIPVFLKSIHLDPALASSIFLTTATDVLGFLVYLSLANLFMPLLI